MLEDESEHEPDEYDPEDDLPNPEEDLAPSIEVPEAPEPMSESEAPDELVRIFWKVVIVVNVGLLAVSLAAMLWFFEGMTTWALRLGAVGVVALGYAYVRYTVFVRTTDVWDDDPDADAPDADESD